MPYDPDSIRDHYNRYGDREWKRLAEDLQGRIKYAIHHDVLDRCVSDGTRALDVGCGPGRFAIDMVRAGASVTLADISPKQLDLAERNLVEAGCGHGISGRHLTDVTRLEPFADAQFDLVVCFGGAVSYVCDRYPDALSELARVVRPGGRVLVSVMSLYGTLRLIGPLDAAGFLERAERHIDWEGVLSGKQVIQSAPGSPEFHLPMALFTSVGLRGALAGAGLEVEGMATANPLVPSFSRIPKITETPAASAAIRGLEFALCREPGLLDTGEHLIAAARRPG